MTKRRLPDRIQFRQTSTDYLVVRQEPDSGTICMQANSASRLMYGGIPVYGNNLPLEFCFGTLPTGTLP